jgi:hypothetical protein
MVLVCLFSHICDDEFSLLLLRNCKVVSNLIPNILSIIKKGLINCIKIDEFKDLKA